MVLQLMAGIQNAVSQQLNQRLGGLEKMLRGFDLSSIGQLEERVIRIEQSLQKINSIDQSVRGHKRMKLTNPIKTNWNRCLLDCVFPLKALPPPRFSTFLANLLVV